MKNRKIKYETCVIVLEVVPYPSKHQSRHPTPVQPDTQETGPQPQASHKWRGHRLYSFMLYVDLDTSKFLLEVNALVVVVISLIRKIIKKEVS